MLERTRRFSERVQIGLDDMVLCGDSAAKVCLCLCLRRCCSWLHWYRLRWLQLYAWGSTDGGGAWKRCSGGGRQRRGMRWRC
eukprot:2169159-Rhodomonas_salina.2